MPLLMNGSDGYIYSLSATSEGSLETTKVKSGSTKACKLHPSDGSHQHTFSIRVENARLTTTQLPYDPSQLKSAILGGGWSLAVNAAGSLAASLE